MHPAVHHTIVDAIAGAIAAAAGAHGHRKCLLRTKPRHITEVSCRAETGPCRHPVARRPHLPPLHALIMPTKSILWRDLTRATMPARLAAAASMGERFHSAGSAPSIVTCLGGTADGYQAAAAHRPVPPGERGS